MRELKVRAWSKKHNKYLKVTGIQYDGDKLGGVFVIYGTVAGIPNTIFLEPEDVVLEQDTGLKDKNRKSICEGDIVLHNKIMLADTDGFFGEEKNVPCVVKRDSIRTGYYPFNYYDTEWGRYTNGSDVEVIGNIHENPELLESTK